MKYKKFKIGTIVTLDEKTIEHLSEENKMQYYSCLGYGNNKLKFFCYLTEIRQAPGHCVLVDLSSGILETFRHTRNFRKAKKKEM